MYFSELLYTKEGQIFFVVLLLITVMLIVCDRFKFRR